MKRLSYITIISALFALTSCEKTVIDENSGNVLLQFAPSSSDATRATVNIGDYFAKLNVQLFTPDGQKVFDKVRTQLRTDDNFGQLACQLSPGTYTVVAVGHSSKISASIKSTEMVQFTASDGEKLTDTFCHCGTVSVGSDGGQYSLTMHRVAAMLRFRLTDSPMPERFAHLEISYTGGSANFNPTTYEGCTKSTQSETRQRNATAVYEAYTFPYLSKSCALKVTLSALASDGTIITTKTMTDVPVARNRITTYTGPLFTDGPTEITQTAFGFTVNPDWDGEDHYTF